MTMTQQTGTQNDTTTSTPRRRARRGIAGLAAAATLAFGGTSLLTATEAQAAGLHASTYQHTYAVTSTTTASTSPSLVRDHA